MKKFGKYFSITLLLLTGLFFVGLLFLFFVPGSSIFRITFISYNERTISSDHKIESVEKIILNSRSYDIEVKSTQSSSISARIENHSLGYVFKENSKLILEESLSNGILTFNISEPHGVAFKNNSSITLYIPENKDVDLQINNKNATVKIEDEDIIIKNFSYKAENGVAKFEKATITGEFNLDLNKSDCYLSDQLTLNSNDVNLKLSTGKFDASSITLGNINILSNERGIIKLNACNSLSQSKLTTGGRIEAKQINSISFFGSDTNLYINEITTRASINLSAAGEVNIEKLSGIADIVTNSGNIKINNCTKNLTTLSIFSKKGDVTAQNAYNKVFVETISGDIITNFASDADTASESNKNVRYFKAITETGKVYSTGVNRADVEIKKDGSAEITFSHFENNLNLNSLIKNNSGNIYLKVDKNSAFMLNSKTSSGHSRINLTQTEKYKGWTDKEITNKAINCETSSNIISIENGSGNILMHDNNVN